MASITEICRHVMSIIQTGENVQKFWNSVTES